MRGWYTIFDMDHHRIGFSPLKGAPYKTGPFAGHEISQNASKSIIPGKPNDDLLWVICISIIWGLAIILIIVIVCCYKKGPEFVGKKAKYRKPG